MSDPDDRHKPVRLLSGKADGGLFEEQVGRLAELADVMDNSHTFRKGQFVRWKAGLKNRAVPAYNEPALVREVLAAPVFDTCEAASCAGSPYFAEPLTLVLAIIDADGDFFELRYDGRRLEPIEG